MSEQSVPGILTNASAEERSRMLTDLLRQWLVDFLEMDHIDEITPNQNFAELGTTSMQAVDFRLSFSGFVSELPVERRAKNEFYS